MHRPRTSIGLAVGGAAGARLTGHLGMQTSPNTILCLVRRLPLPSVDRLRAVSIDDWAVRKRRTYGTLLVEFDRRCPINRLPDRTGATVTDWLGRRPSIQIVARDRSTEYARAAAAGASAALGSPTDGITFSTCAKRSNAGSAASMAGCASYSLWTCTAPSPRSWRGKTAGSGMPAGSI